MINIPLHFKKENLKVSVVMPVFNEELTIQEIIRKVQKEDIKKEVIIVDDSSTDGTRDILQPLEGIDGIDQITN